MSLLQNQVFALKLGFFFTLCLLLQVSQMTSHIESQHPGRSLRMRRPLPVIVTEQQMAALQATRAYVTGTPPPRSKSPAGAASPSRSSLSPPKVARRGRSPLVALFAPASVSRSRSGSKSPAARLESESQAGAPLQRQRVVIICICAVCLYKSRV